MGGDACVVYHGASTCPEDFDAGAGTEPRWSWRSADDLFERAADDHAAILVVDKALLEHPDRLKKLAKHVVVVAADAATLRELGDRADVSIVGLHDATAKASVLDVARRLAVTKHDAARLERDSARRDGEFRELSRIGTALMHERDRSALLDLIVNQGKQLTESDGAGLLFLRHTERGADELYSVKYTIDSLPHLGRPDIKFAIDGTSIVGHAALIKQPVVVDDVLKLPPDTTYVASEEFQRRYDYHARSMMAVPMLTQRGDVLGVLFFINHKSDPRATIRTVEDADKYVLPYTDRQVRLALALASMAAVSIDASRLYDQIEHMLESFVKAAVSAVDARDPTTAGHSLRVAALTVALAEAVDRVDRGAYRDTRFTRAQLRELRYAALLHDLGKVTVREDVLMKAKKLPMVLWERVQARFALIRETIRLEHCSRGDGDLAEALREVDRMLDVVREANEPSVFSAPRNAALEDIGRRTFLRADGSSSHYLAPEELRFLELARGTLDPSERAEIESHVDNTRRFLAQIPWTDDLKNLVTFAYGHHEKLNGTGYPRRLESGDIPVQTRMITLADIFDALTEADRPYKPAVSPDVALDILRSEAKAGQLDGDLVEIMVDSRAYAGILGTDWRRL
jgi:HD-GYP domain-containing protein (c-di-GMP phosphodiesterase class II)